MVEDVVVEETAGFCQQQPKVEISRCSQPDLLTVTYLCSSSVYECEGPVQEEEEEDQEAAVTLRVVKTCSLLLNW